MSTDIFEKTSIERDKLFSSLGNVDPTVISHLINPAFMGGPIWPSMRQAFSVIRTDESIKVVSNGLSDPFNESEKPNNGFKLELFAETKEPLYSDVSNTWLYRLVYAIAQQAAHNGCMADLLQEYGVLSMEIHAEDSGLEEFQNEHGMVGVMIGVEHPNIPRKVTFPAEDITFASVQLLTPNELNYVCEKGEEGRNYLRDLMLSSNLYHYIVPNRDSLIELDRPITKKPWWRFW